MLLHAIQCIHNHGHSTIFTVTIQCALQAEDLDAAHASLQPAIQAINTNKHKQLCWNAQHAPLPNSCCCSTERSGSDVSTLTSPFSSAIAHCAASDSSTSSDGSDECTDPCITSSETREADNKSAPPSSVLPLQCGRQPLFLARFHAAWVHAGMATVGVSLLEKQRRYEEAVDLLQRLLGGNCCPSRRGLWWLRLSINLEHLGRVEIALEVGWPMCTGPSARCVGVYDLCMQAESGMQPLAGNNGQLSRLSSSSVINDANDN